MLVKSVDNSSDHTHILASTTLTVLELTQKLIVGMAVSDPCFRYKILACREAA
jgi:hypothetical protein